MDRANPIGVIKGIGEKTEKLFEKLNINTVGELLEHYPSGYEVYDKIRTISMINEGEYAIISASLLKHITTKKIHNLTIINCIVKDYTGSIMLTWFNMPFLKNVLKLGCKYIFRGKAVKKNGILVLEQPQILKKEEYYNKLNILQPRYPLTKGLSNNLIAKSVKIAFEETLLEKDFLPVEIRKNNNLPEYKWTLREIHYPKSHENMLMARKRIVFDEFFFFTLALNELKCTKKTVNNFYVMEKRENCYKLLNSLPYNLTNSQLKVFKEIEQDMKGISLMNRLIQGDVGSGKTILAALALLMVAENGFEGSLMVPTEVLAIQHYETLTELLKPFNVKIVLLTGSTSAKEKRIIYEQIKTHECDIIIGTHALIQEKVIFDKLALVITDEQHRFGVRQREQLARKGKSPHIMVMSATPIPRTLSIILYGDLDISIIDELPAKRLPIKNCVVNTDYRTTAYHFIEKEILKGRQAYIICPMVEESENIEAENVIEYTQKIKEELSSDIRIEYLHGKMKAKEKNQIMESYAKGDINVLVSTTVVEVGVNVQNATVMMIENAERFGLAQLHQLRGRVGRGTWQSYCILVSTSTSKETKERLDILNKSNDGFFIASEDLRLRGSGDMFGIRQSGMLEFKMADIFADADILKAANDVAKAMTKKEITKMCENNSWIKEKMYNYTGKTVL